MLPFLPEYGDWVASLPFERSGSKFGRAYIIIFDENGDVERLAEGDEAKAIKGELDDEVAFISADTSAEGGAGGRGDHAKFGEFGWIFMDPFEIPDSEVAFESIRMGLQLFRRMRSKGK